MIKAKNQNHTLDILKALCAILIVFNHCVFPQEMGKVIKDISRIGVPIFFIISGYYVYENNDERIKKKFKRILLMLVGACIFWLLYTIIRYALISPIEIKPYLKKFLDPECLFRFVLFNDNIFWGHLWFLNALLYCYGIEFIKSKLRIKDHLKIELLIVFILLIGYFLLNHFLIDDGYSNAYYIRNFIFVGLPFFLIGKNIHHFDFNINKKYIVLLIFSFSILFIERIIYSSEIYISSIITSILLFVLCLKKPNIKNNKLEYIGKNLNIYIYVFHPAIKYIVLDTINYCHLNNDIVMYIYPIIVLFITILFSYLIYKFNSYITIKTTKK